ncbi:unnamed protein product [Adineta ricciae]|uniref:G-protein coupled receptors family 1 profile domain-containing protein n=1 Tax=Adineta ricciae TaxID=249248 RepID=A0A814ZRX4_ADIRI|nr:unnamed protein product [Adineta ricciae]
MTNSTLNGSIDYPNLSNVGLPYVFQFWFLLLCEIPSLICYLTVFIYILCEKRQRRALYNHTILVLLSVAFAMVAFDYSWTIDSCYHNGQVWLAQPLFCEVWWMLDYGFFNACTVILAWSSFERHILIFHSSLSNTRRKRLIFHYFPLTFLVTYLGVFYIYAIFFASCENQYDYGSPVCGAYPCYLTIPLLAVWDSVGHGTLPAFLIIIFNIGLLWRIIWQKRHHHRNWRKFRKMALQLLSIAFIYIFINFPPWIINTIQLSGHPDWGAEVFAYLFFFSTLTQFLYPFAYLIHLPGVGLYVKKRFIREHRRVEPGRT